MAGVYQGSGDETLLHPFDCGRDSGGNGERHLGLGLPSSVVRVIDFDVVTKS